jgi:hypothetical protein
MIRINEVVCIGEMKRIEVNKLNVICSSCV